MSSDRYFTIILILKHVDVFRDRLLHSKFIYDRINNGSSVRLRARELGMHNALGHVTFGGAACRSVK